MDFEQITGDDGQRFVYADSGDGPLVVLFHGFPDTPFGWTDTVAALNAMVVVPALKRSRFWRYAGPATLGDCSRVRRCWATNCCTRVIVICARIAGRALVRANFHATTWSRFQRVESMFG